MKLANHTVPVSETVLVIVFVAEEWRGKLVRKRGKKKVQDFFNVCGRRGGGAEELSAPSSGRDEGRGLSHSSLCLAFLP